MKQAGNSASKSSRMHRVLMKVTRAQIEGHCELLIRVLGPLIQCHFFPSSDAFSTDRKDQRMREEKQRSADVRDADRRSVQHHHRREHHSSSYRCDPICLLRDSRSSRRRSFPLSQATTRFLLLFLMRCSATGDVNHAVTVIKRYLHLSHNLVFIGGLSICRKFIFCDGIVLTSGRLSCS